MLRLDRPPAAAVELVREALGAVAVDEVYTDEPVLVGRVTGPGGPRHEYVVDVGPLETGGTTLSVSARYREAPSTGGPPWRLEQDLIGEIERLAGPDLEFLPTLDRIGPDGDGARASAGDPWGALGDHEAVEETGRRSLGWPVYETEVVDRVATAAVVRPEAGSAAPAVSVGTPMRAARRGTGFEIRTEGGELARAAFGGPGEPPELSRTARDRLTDLETVGRLVVDDRLATVEHVVGSLADGEAFRAHARAVVAVARSVEAEA